MKIEINPYSHCGRLATHITDYPKSYNEPYAIRSQEETVVNGRVMKKSVYKNIVPSDMFKGMNALDFALENVIAAGAVGSLREGRLSLDRFTLCEMADTNVDNILNAVDAEIQQNNVQTNEE